MIVVDSSGLISLVLQETVANEIDSALSAAASPEMSTANYLETITVLAHRQSSSPRDTWRSVDELLRIYRITLAPVDQLQSRAAVEAMIRFGKGFHRARLNYGDCFAYALAKMRNAPLLFIGDDFTHTDIEPAIAQL